MIVVIQVSEIHLRIVEVDVIVKVILKIIVNIVAAAHGDHAAKLIGMLEVGVYGKQSSKRRTCCQRFCIFAALVANKRQHFLRYVFVVARQHLHLPARMRLFIQQAVAVYRIDRIRTNKPRLDKILDRVDQIKPFVFEIIGSGRREHQQRITRMPVSHERHIHPQIVTKPRGCIASH